MHYIYIIKLYYYFNSFFSPCIRVFLETTTLLYYFVESILVDGQGLQGGAELGALRTVVAGSTGQVDGLHMEEHLGFGLHHQLALQALPVAATSVLHQGMYLCL